MGVEKALKHSYNALNDTWTKTKVRVELEPKPFSEGCLRVAHRMWEYDDAGGRSLFVAKFSKVEVKGGWRAQQETYFNDVKTQMVAESYAQEYNKRKPSKKVAFVPAYVVELAERAGHPVCAVEPFLEGSFRKHNNNDGDVASKRNAPQAFSHFTYEASARALLVCDIQGVQDFYTDPQIHTHDGRGFGLGNCGAEGIQRFLASHRCNDECRRVGMGRPGAGLQAPGRQAGHPGPPCPPAPEKRGPRLPAGGRAQAQASGGRARALAPSPAGSGRGPGQWPRGKAPQDPSKGPSTLLAERLARSEARQWAKADAELARQLSMEEQDKHQGGPGRIGKRGVKYYTK